MQPHNSSCSGMDTPGADKMIIAGIAYFIKFSNKLIIIYKKFSFRRNIFEWQAVQVLN
jgi:hypothetical protein